HRRAKYSQTSSLGFTANTAQPHCSSSNLSVPVYAKFRIASPLGRMQTIGPLLSPFIACGVTLVIFAIFCKNEFVKLADVFLSVYIRVIRGKIRARFHSLLRVAEQNR